MIFRFETRAFIRWLLSYYCWLDLVVKFGVAVGILVMFW